MNWMCPETSTPVQHHCTRTCNKYTWNLSTQPSSMLNFPMKCYSLPLHPQLPYQTLFFFFFEKFNEIMEVSAHIAGVVVPQQWCCGHFGLLSGWLWLLISSVVLKWWNFGRIGEVTASDRIPSLIHVLCPHILRHRVVKASVDSSLILFEKLVWDFYQSQVPSPLQLHILHIKLSRHLPIRLVDLQVILF